MHTKSNGIFIISVIISVIACILLCFNMVIIIKGIIHPSTPPSVFGVTPMVVLSGSMSGTAKYQYQVDALPNTQYALIDSSNQIIAKGTSTSEGKLTFWNVPTGEYTLKIITGENEFTEGGTEVEIRDEWMDVNIQPGDLILVKKQSFNTLKTGDIISFMDTVETTHGEIKYTMVTHRIIEKTTNVNGEVAFRTKGDANPIYDDDLVTEKNYVGIYNKKITGLGNVVLFFQKPIGIILIVFFALVGLVGITILSRRRNKTDVEQENESLRKELAALKAERQSSNTNLQKGESPEHV